MEGRTRERGLAAQQRGPQKARSEVAQLAHHAVHDARQRSVEMEPICFIAGPHGRAGVGPVVSTILFHFTWKVIGCGRHSIPASIRYVENGHSKRSRYVLLPSRT